MQLLSFAPFFPNKIFQHLIFKANGFNESYLPSANSLALKLNYTNIST